MPDPGGQNPEGGEEVELAYLQISIVSWQQSLTPEQMVFNGLQAGRLTCEGLGLSVVSLPRSGTFKSIFLKSWKAASGPQSASVFGVHLCARLGSMQLYLSISAELWAARRMKFYSWGYFHHFKLV